uniref:Putative ribonuclease H-like domain-containing protein n=1 Tax=Tanacetum cinerariifolium TaxID=118510 RepID=A0A6L2KZK5_TANCI|nr:putative ribonuclease H-like domain-containing protein [Tanacetum cinerariifolium]
MITVGSLGCFFATKDETSPIFKTFITGLENQLSLKVKVIRSDNGTEFKNNDLNQFCGMKGIKREFSVPRTPQQNGIAKRKNKTLIEAARTMLVDLLLPIPFWAGAVNTACCVHNRVLVTKPHNKTPYELLHGRTPSIGSGHTWLFDIDSLTRTMNYHPITAGNQTNPSAGSQDKFAAEKAEEEIDQQYVLFPVWSFGSTNPQNNDRDAAFDGKEHDFDAKKPESEFNVSPSSSAKSRKQDDKTKKEAKGKNPVESFIRYRDLSAKFEDCFDNNINKVNAAGTIVPTVGQNSPNNTNTFSAAGHSNAAASLTHGKSSFIDASQLPDDLDMPELEDITYSDDEDEVGADADFNNLETSITVSHIPTTRFHKDHPVSQEWLKIKVDFHRCLMMTSILVCLPTFFYRRNPRGYIKLLMIQVGLKLCRKSFFNSRCRKNKARLVAQGYTQKEGTNYEEVFTPIAMIEAIRLFLAYASFMGFMVYQMDVKGAFLYGTIEEEVYVYQPLGFEDPDHPNKVYKVVKALYGLHQVPRAWYETLANYLLENGFQRGKIDQTLFIKRQKGDILLVQIYVDDIIFGATNKDLCKSFEKLMKDKFQMSLMGELTFFLGLQVKQKKDGIFISQDKYVAKILRKFRLTEGKSASTPIDTEKHLLKDPDGEDVDVHTYRLMIGSLMYLTSSRPDIMFACKKQTVISTSSTKAEYVAAASCCAQVLWIQNQLLDYGDLPLLGDNTPRSDEDKLELMELTVLLLPKVEKVRIRVNVVDLQVSAVSEGFNHLIDFLKGSSIKYALTVNPNIYVSCIKQFWTTVAVKPIIDVTRLQALVDKKKVVVTEATIREVLHLDDAEGVDCLPNEEIFAELARMGYEKPSTKLTFYKAFFSSQWKFLIHTILQCMSAKRTSWNEFSSSMESAVKCLSSDRKFNFSKYIFDSLVRNVDSTTKFYMYPHFLQLIIRKQVGDLSTHTTKYTSPALTQKVFANMRRVRKGFSRVETPLFKGMLVDQQVDKEGDADENVEEVNGGDAAEGDVSAAHGKVPTVAEKPSIPSPTPPTPPPQPPQDIPSTSQVLQTPPQSPQRVKKLEKRNKVRVLKLRRLQKVGISRRIETSDDTVMDDESNQERMIAEIDQDDVVVLEDDKEEDKEVADAVKDVKEAKEDDKPAEIQEVVDVVITAKLITEVVTAASETVTAASVIITTAEAQVLAATLTAAPARIEQDEQYARELHAELNKDIDWDEVINHVKIKAKEDPTVKKYQALKRKPQTKSQARKNMILYLKNVVGFKMDYFKGMSYDDIRLIFKAKFNSNVAFLLKTKEHIEEDKNRALQKLNETPIERAAKRRKLDEKVEELKNIFRLCQIKMMMSILKLPYLLKREDLEALWSLVMERFSTTKPKNFSDDFLLVTLGAMFEKPDIHA